MKTHPTKKDINDEMAGPNPGDTLADVDRLATTGKTERQEQPKAAYTIDKYHFTAADVDDYRDAYSRPELSDQENDDALRLALADAASERARIYATPAEWNTILNDDGTATVTRKRIKH